MAGEAVNLAVFDADSMVLLYREQGPQSVTISSRLGSHRPMHASSLGKAFLSAMDEAERRVLLGRVYAQALHRQHDHQRRRARTRDRRDQASRLCDRSQRIRGDARLLARRRSSTIAASRSRRSVSRDRQSVFCRSSTASAAWSRRPPRRSPSGSASCAARCLDAPLALSTVSFDESVSHSMGQPLKPAD